MGKSQEVVVVTCTLVRETDKAFLIEVNETEYWIPKSQVSNQEVDEDTDECLLTMSAWIAKEKGLR